MRKYALFAMLAFLPVTACSDRKKPAFTEAELGRIPITQNVNLPDPSGGFVLSVKGETITSDEMISPALEPFRKLARETSFEQFQAQAGPQIEQALIAKISNILLYQQAKKQGGEQIDEALEKAAEEEMRKFLVSFGGDYAKAEEALKQMGMNWAKFKDYEKRMILSQSYISTKMPKDKPITYSDLMNYYNAMKEKHFAKPAMLVFRLIDIEVAKVETSDPNEDQLEKAQNLADELMKRLRAGEDFAKLAQKYSNGYGREAGGLWWPVAPESLAAPYDVLAREAEKIQPGQLAGPITSGEHILIMKLEDKQGGSVVPFEKVQKELEAKISFERRKQAVDKFGTELVEQAIVGEKDAFINFCLERIYQISNQQDKKGKS